MSTPSGPPIKRCGEGIPSSPQQIHHRYLIVAANARHAHMVAQSRQLPSSQWHYITEGYQLDGIGHGYTVLVYDTWHDLPFRVVEPLRQLIKRAEVRGAIVEHVYERDIR